MTYIDAMFGIEVRGAQAGVQLVAHLVQSSHARQQLHFVLKIVNIV